MLCWEIPYSIQSMIQALQLELLILTSHVKWYVVLVWRISGGIRQMSGGASDRHLTIVWQTDKPDKQQVSDGNGGVWGYLWTTIWGIVTDLAFTLQAVSSSAVTKIEIIRN